MRHPVNALHPELVKTAEAARAAKAAELYDREALRAAMVKAAGGGFDSVTIVGPAGLDLRSTAAAKTAETWLKGEGIDVRWDPRAGASATDAAAIDLVLTWRTTPKVGG